MAKRSSRLILKAIQADWGTSSVLCFEATQQPKRLARAASARNSNQQTIRLGRIANVERIVAVKERQQIRQG